MTTIGGINEETIQFVDIFFVMGKSAYENIIDILAVAFFVCC